MGKSATTEPSTPTGSDTPGRPERDGDRRGTEARRIRRVGGLTHLRIVLYVSLALFAAIALLSPWLAPYDPLEHSVGPPLAPLGSPGFPLGTDAFGRDQVSRLLVGSRTLIGTSVLAALIAGAVGGVVGLVSGFVGGIFDTIVMRGMDAMRALPTMLLAIMIVAAFGTGFRNLVVAIAVAQIPVFARLARAMTAREADQDYVQAARVSGFRPTSILFRQISPNVVGPLVVQFTSVLAISAGFASALSYLGLGIRPPTPDWGYMVQEGQEFVFSQPWLAILPGLLIALFVITVNFLGDELRDKLDPQGVGQSARKS